MAVKKPITTRGGARPNAGRRADLTTPANRVTVTLPYETIERARVIGGGNVSAGIRAAVAKYI